MAIKKLINGYSTNILLIIVSALLTFILVDFQSVKCDVKENTKFVIEAVECDKYWKIQMMTLQKDVYDNTEAVQLNRENIIRISSDAGITIRGDDSEADSK